MRKHGFSRPLDPNQVGAIIFTCALVACCYALQMPFVEDLAPRIVLVVLYSIAVAGVALLFIICGSTDPGDPGLQGGTDGAFYCALCQAHVGSTSKHCRACDKCVEGFDHHCKWLNNCVGAKNYKYFFTLVGFTLCMGIIQFTWAAWQFITSFTDKAALKAQVHDVYNGSVNYIGWQVMLALYMVLLSAAIMMMGELFFFHVALMTRGLTTYDYIIAQREQQMTGHAGHAPISFAGTLKQLVLCEPCCKQGRVHDEAAARKRIKVGLNPCAALSTVKLNGNPQSWQQQGLSTPPKGSLATPQPAATPATVNGTPTKMGGLPVSEQRQLQASPIPMHQIHAAAGHGGHVEDSARQSGGYPQQYAHLQHQHHAAAPGHHVASSPASPGPAMQHAMQHQQPAAASHDAAAAAAAQQQHQQQMAMMAAAQQQQQHQHQQQTRQGASLSGTPASPGGHYVGGTASPYANVPMQASMEGGPMSILAAMANPRASGNVLGSLPGAGPVSHSSSGSLIYPEVGGQPPAAAVAGAGGMPAAYTAVRTSLNAMPVPGHGAAAQGMAPQ